MASRTRLPRHWGDADPPACQAANVLPIRMAGPLHELRSDSATAVALETSDDSPSTNDAPEPSPEEVVERIVSMFELDRESLLESSNEPSPTSEEAPKPNVLSTTKVLAALKARGGPELARIFERFLPPPGHDPSAWFKACRQRSEAEADRTS